MEKKNIPGGELSAKPYLKDGQWRDKFGELIRTPENENSVIEQRSGMSEKAKEYYAGRIDNYVNEKLTKGEQIDRGVAERYIYNYMTNRRSPEELDQMKNKFEDQDHLDYQNTLDQIINEGKQTGAEAERKAAWFGIGRTNPAAMPRENMKTNKGENVKVMFKEYFSFVPKSPDQKGIAQEIQAFLKVLPEIESELSQAAQETKDDIQLKVPLNLEMFLKHSDSLVAHFKNEKNGDMIRAKIENILQNKNLATARKDRAESGFDFESSKGQNSKFNGSNSELIARVISQEMTDSVEKNKGFNKIKTPEELAERLDREIQSKGKLTPEEMLRHLQNIKT
ncbi:MAG: hypothetical protein Q8P07_00815 [bacterium]|nr:hypothetical protein [bacterium]